MTLVDEETYEGVVWEDDKITASSAKSVSIISATMQKMSFVENDSTIAKSLFSTFSADEIRLFSSRVTDSKLVYAQMVKGNIKDVVFKDCKMDEINFHQASLTNTKFINCSLNKAVFHEANLKRVVFEDCAFDEAEFSSVHITSATFDGCSLEAANGLSSLKNSSIDYQTMLQIAPSLMKQLGVEIHDKPIET